MKPCPSKCGSRCGRSCCTASGLEISNAKLHAARGHPAHAATQRRRADADLRPAQELPPGQYTLALHFAGKLTEQPRGLYIAPLPGQRRHRQSARHADGSRRLPAHVSLLGRAGLPRGVRPHRGRAGKAARHFQHAGRRRKAAGRRPPRKSLSRPRRRWPATSSRWPSAISRKCATKSKACNSPCYTTPGKREQARYALEATKKILTYLPRLLRHQISAAQARPNRHSQHRRGRDGELGLHHLQRQRPALRPGDQRAEHARTRLRGDRPRDRAPMVWQPRDHGVVGQSLAQRRLRQLDGHQVRPIISIPNGKCGCAPRAARNTRCASTPAPPRIPSSSRCRTIRRPPMASTRSPTARARRCCA